MIIKVGSARHSETGGINGKKGDQTGGEVSTQNYYLHKKGWYVLRAISPQKRNIIGDTMQAMCDNNAFGYGQADRLSGYTEASHYGFDVKKVKTPCNVDCSTAVRICCHAAGIDLPNITTANERRALLNTKAFIDVTSKVNTRTGENLLYGDILVTKSKGHTVVVTKGAEGVSNVPIQKSESQSQSSKFIGEVYNCSRLNVRTKPSGVAAIEIKHPVLLKGDRVTVCDKVGNWYYVLIGGTIYAYVSAKYIKKA